MTASMLGIYSRTLNGCLGLRGRNLLAATTLLSGLGFCLVGYDNGLMGGFINGDPFQRTFNNPKTIIVSTVVAIYEVGGFFGSLVILVVGDLLGRRQSIALGAVVLTVGAILQASAFGLGQMFTGRVISGIGVGIMQSTIPILQAEVSPKELRGFFAAVYCTILNLGIVLAYWLDFGLSYWDNEFSWRFPTAFQIVFLIAIIALTVVVPESPRWLLVKDHANDSVEVIAALLDEPQDSPAVNDFFVSIKDAVLLERTFEDGSWRDFFRPDGIQSARRIWTACMVQAFQQLGGCNAIIYYASTLFQNSIGFSPRMAGLMSGFLNTWLFVASFLPWVLLDRLGRKPLLLIGTGGQLVAMVIQSAMIYQVQHNTAIRHSAAAVAATMLFLFQGAFTIGNQSAVWVYPSELLPLKLRAKGSALSTAANWICNFLIVEITPPAIENIGYKTYIIFSVLNLVFLPIIGFYFKETKGLSLEEVDLLFASGDVLVDPMFELGKKEEEGTGSIKTNHIHHAAFN